VKPCEIRKRNDLKKKKPYVYNKIIKLDEKLANGEGIPILQFQYSYSCNFKCKHCCTEKMWQTQLTARGKRHFELSDIRELSRQADEMGLSTFVITGGEPLLFPNLDEIVMAINPNKFWIAMDTNGWFLNNEKARHLKEIGIDKVQLSMDGANSQTHDTFRRQEGSWARCIRAIKACKKVDLYIILQTVIWKNRTQSKEFHDFLEMAKELGVGTYITYVKPVGLYEGRYDQLVTSKDEETIREFEKEYDIFTHWTPSYGMDVGCIAVKRMISITRYGDIMPCPYMHISLGNFFKEPLKDIITRGLHIKWFNPRIKMPCLIGVDRAFMEKVLLPTYGDSEIPVPYDKIFTKEDYI